MILTTSDIKVSHGFIGQPVGRLEQKRFGATTDRTLSHAIAQVGGFRGRKEVTANPAGPPTDVAQPAGTLKSSANAWSSGDKRWETNSGVLADQKATPMNPRAIKRTMDQTALCDHASTTRGDQSGMPASPRARERCHPESPCGLRPHPREMKTEFF